MANSIPQLIFYSHLLHSTEDDETLFLKMLCGNWLARPTPLQENIVTGIGDLITQIYVPAPKDVEIGTTLKYADDSTSLVNQLEGIGILSMPFAETEFGQRKLDFTDSVFLGAEKRKYNLKFTLVAKKDEDGLKISEISKTLQALSLPTIETGYNALAAPKMFVPPLWRFGIGKGVGTDISYDWLGVTTTCVLQSVRVNPTAGGFPYAVDNLSGTPLPLMVSFSLGFIEYTPAFRDAKSTTNIVSRGSGISKTNAPTPRPAPTDQQQYNRRNPM